MDSAEQQDDALILNQCARALYDIYDTHMNKRGWPDRQRLALRREQAKVVLDTAKALKGGDRISETES